MKTAVKQTQKNSIEFKNFAYIFNFAETCNLFPTLIFIFYSILKFYFIINYISVMLIKTLKNYHINETKIN